MWWTLQMRAIDAEYHYVTEGYSFYHAHLKISDLDKNTAQPLVWDTIVVGLVWEIYNKSEILKRIHSTLWEDECTELEVIALAYEALGETFINIVNGEFAISIYDTEKQKYILYRDRWGVNNLYYRLYKGELYYSSEIKSLILDTPLCSQKSMVDHLIFQFGISPDTIVEDIFILRPWTYLVYEDKRIQLQSFENYIPQESSSWIIETIEKSIIRRIPHFQKQIFVSLSGWPDSNLILYFLKKHYKGEIIAYTFFTDKNAPDAEIAIRNAKKLEVKHLLIDMNEYEYTSLWEDLYTHEWLVFLPDLWKILKEKFPQYKHIKVDFWGDGKEELILGNSHYAYKEILARCMYFRKKNLCPNYTINPEFLNKEMFDYNLQMIDKLTLRNGIERRLPFTDFEMLQFFKYKGYRSKAEDFLKKQDLSIVNGEFGYDLWIKFSNIYDAHLAENKNILFSHLKQNIIQLTQ